MTFVLTRVWISEHTALQMGACPAAHALLCMHTRQKCSLTAAIILETRKTFRKEKNGLN